MMMKGSVKYWQIVSNSVFYLQKIKKVFVALYIDIVTRRHSIRICTAGLLTTVWLNKVTARLCFHRCLWVCSQGMAGRQPWADTTPGQTPPLGRHPPRSAPLSQTHPWADTPWADTPWADTPSRVDTSRQTPLPWQTPTSRRLLQRTVHILLECNLVLIKFPGIFPNNKLGSPPSGKFWIRNWTTHPVWLNKVLSLWFQWILRNS